MAGNTDTGVTKIDEKFLKRGDLFGLKYSNGFLFMEVTGWEQLQFRPFEGVGAIQPQTNSGFTRLEHNDDDLLHVDTKKEKVLHVGIGQAPASLRRYTNYPEGENRLRTIPNLSVPRSGSGTDYGYVDGNDSPFEAPTDAEELFVPPGVHLDFDFYNPNQNETVNPKLNIKMREYNVRILDPRDNNDRNAINRILSPGTPIPVAPVGSIDSQTNFNLRNDWGQEPISEGQLRSMGGGR